MKTLWGLKRKLMGLRSLLFQNTFGSRTHTGLFTITCNSSSMGSDVLHGHPALTMLMMVMKHSRGLELAQRVKVLDIKNLTI